MRKLPVLPMDHQLSTDGRVTDPWWLFFDSISKWLRNYEPSQSGTHATRLTLSGLPDGTLYAETDRTVIYEVRAEAWVYLLGTMRGTVTGTDQRPADLGTADAGFLFFGTDTFVTFRWDGAAWTVERALGSILSGTHGARPATTNYPVNAEYLETDRNALYRNVAGTWTLSRTAILSCTQATLPGSLGSGDAGLLVWVTDYCHMLEWNGTGWQWGPGEAGNGWIEGFYLAPNANGWAQCNGATVNYLKSDGTTGSIALPNLMATPAYPQLGAAYVGINPAVAPTAANNGFGALVDGTNTTYDVAGRIHTHAITLGGDPIANFGLTPYFRQ